MTIKTVPFKGFPVKCPKCGACEDPVKKINVDDTNSWPPRTVAVTLACGNCGQSFKKEERE